MGFVSNHSPKWPQTAYAIFIKVSLTHSRQACWPCVSCSCTTADVLALYSLVESRSTTYSLFRFIPHLPDSMQNVQNFATAVNLQNKMSENASNKGEDKKIIWGHTIRPLGCESSLDLMSLFKIERWLWKVICSLLGRAQVLSWQVSGQMDRRILVKTNKGICGVCIHSTLCVQGCSAAERACTSRINLY